MPKLRWGKDITDPDFDELDDAEYEEGGGDFPEYDGPIPPKNTMLMGSVEKVWATESKAGNAMFKVVFRAKGNKDAKEKYNGLSIWDNVVWTPQTKFRWQPWLDAFGLTTRDIKGRTSVAEEDDNVGTPVLRIGKVQFPQSCRVITDTDVWNDEKKATISKYLPPADQEDEEDYDEDEDEPPF